MVLQLLVAAIYQIIQTENILMTITKENAIAEQTHVHYRLLSAPNKDGNYYIQIILNQEKCTRRLPCTEREKAKEIYEMLKQGRVTPCTLGYILEDMK